MDLRLVLVIHQPARRSYKNRRRERVSPLQPHTKIQSSCMPLSSFSRTNG
jgi:hypothetical protein